MQEAEAHIKTMVESMGLSFDDYGKSWSLSYPAGGFDYRQFRVIRERKVKRERGWDVGGVVSFIAMRGEVSNFNDLAFKLVQHLGIRSLSAPQSHQLHSDLAALVRSAGGRVVSHGGTAYILDVVATIRR